MRISRTGALLTIALLLSVLAGCDIWNFRFTASVEERTVADLVNEHRASFDLPSLEWSSEVYFVAEAHSQDMHDRDYFSHTNPDGDDTSDRLTAAGVSYSTAAENIAYGYATPEEVVSGWLDSPGHRANIEKESLTHHGIGWVADGNYWTHVFIGE